MNIEKLKQTIMLKKALTEEGLDPKKYKIEIDHDTGHSYVNDLKLPIIFPKSHFKFAEDCHTQDKKFMFYFNGNAGKGNTREKLMYKFLEQDNSKVIFNNDDDAGSQITVKIVMNDIRCDRFFAL